MADFQWNMDGFKYIRKCAGMEQRLRAKGTAWCAALNAELRAAEASRGQPIADGYTFHITGTGDRLRLHIVAETARAQAHEARHQSILKLMDMSDTHLYRAYPQGLPAELGRRGNAARATGTP